jgi:hypothetical protein
MQLKYLIVISAIILYSCSPSYNRYIGGYKGTIKTEEADYSNLNFWAAHPWKHDPSDSVPRPLRKKFSKDSIADVFFIHPTTLTASHDMRRCATFMDEKLNAKTDFSTILFQASAFNEKCRVFAPRYRQAHYRSFFTTDSLTQHYFDLAYSDIKHAFEYYLEHFNNGRPIIIASHSQGTIHAERLLKEFFENKPLAKNLVCAYIIGMPIPHDYFQVLKPCTDPNQTGCFVSWRTFNVGFIEPLFVAKEKFKCDVVNPLTWSTQEGMADFRLNKGAVLKKFNKVLVHNVRTQVHGNVLWSSKPKFFGSFLLKVRTYHIADINLFYVDIGENIKQRIAAYLKR